GQPGGGTIGLFRRDVARRPKTGERPGEITRSCLGPGQAEIADQRFAAFVEKDVARLEIAMEDAFFVRVLNSVRHLEQQLDALARMLKERSASLQQAARRGVLHRVIWKAVSGLADLIDRDNVRMVQTRGCFRFAPITRDYVIRIALIS